MCTPVIPATGEAKVGGLQSEAGPRQKLKTLSKKNKAKKIRAGGMTRVVACLLSKHEALNSNPSTAEKKLMEIDLEIIC
jgi:hypothetical protein